MDMMREDRSAAFRVAAEATPERYVDVGFLGGARRLAGVPRRAMARANQGPAVRALNLNPADTGGEFGVGSLFAWWRLGRTTSACVFDCRESTLAGAEAEPLNSPPVSLGL